MENWAYVKMPKYCSSERVKVVAFQVEDPRFQSHHGEFGQIWLPSSACMMEVQMMGVFPNS